jgi:hypothetical protein
MNTHLLNHANEGSPPHYRTEEVLSLSHHWKLSHIAVVQEKGMQKELAMEIHSKGIASTVWLWPFLTNQNGHTCVSYKCPKAHGNLLHPNCTITFHFVSSTLLESNKAPGTLPVDRCLNIGKANVSNPILKNEGLKINGLYICANLHLPLLIWLIP